MGSVIAGKIGQRLNVGQFIYGHDDKFRSEWRRIDRSEYALADSAITIYSNFITHFLGIYILAGKYLLTTLFFFAEVVSHALSGLSSDPLVAIIITSICLQ